MSDVLNLREALPLLAQQPHLLLLFAWLLLAAVIDWRSLRIPNWITGPGLLWGLLVCAWQAPQPTQGVFGVE